MRNFILIILLCATTLVWAGESTLAPKDSQPVVMDTDTAKKEYRTKNYTVKEEIDVVRKALDVFKQKGRKVLYRKKVWIYTTPEEDNASFLSFMTNDQNQAIVFSPDEEFVYYVEISPSGGRRLTGVAVGSKKEFFISETVESFFIETCEDRGTSYLVVLDGKEVEGYYIYDLQGRSIGLPDMPADVNDLKRVICY